MIHSVVDLLKNSTFTVLNMNPVLLANLSSNKSPFFHTKTIQESENSIINFFEASSSEDWKEVLPFI